MRMNKENDLQVYLEEWKYKIKKTQIPRFINTELDSDSESDDDSDNDCDNDSNNDYDYDYDKKVIATSDCYIFYFRNFISGFYFWFFVILL